MTTLNQKLTISLASAGLFALLNLPCTYNFTNKLSNDLFKVSMYDEEKTCPTNIGLIVHALVFLLITYISMYNINQKDGIKWKHSIIGALIFYLVSSPAIFSVVGKLFGDNFSTSEGCPKNKGILLHSLVYAVILLGMMNLPENCSIIKLDSHQMLNGLEDILNLRRMF